ncbi:MAG: methyltransferase domain-containing protein [Bacteroidia bacterium]
MKQKGMEASYKKSIVKYYDDTRIDYRWLWLNKKNRSVHFGFYEDGISEHSDALENLNKVLAERVGIKDGDRILDAGCGQGGSALWLAEKYQVQVEGITLVPHQVRMAKEETTKRKLEAQLNFSEQDYTSTNFADESFDVVWACESMCHAERKEDFYKEMFRVLKPGGRMICADYIRADRPLTADGELVIHQWLDGWSIKDIDTYEEHLASMRNCGLVNAEIHDVTQNTRPSLKHLYSMSSKLWGLGKLLNNIGLRNNVMHGNQFGSIKQYEALEKGYWYYGIIKAEKPA